MANTQLLVPVRTDELFGLNITASMPNTATPNPPLHAPRCQPATSPPGRNRSGSNRIVLLTSDATKTAPSVSASSTHPAPACAPAARLSTGTQASQATTP